MLVLERKYGDFIVLNDNIFITVFDPSQTGNKVKIAIEAPKDVSIVRGELLAETADVRTRLEKIKKREKKNIKK